MKYLIVAFLLALAASASAGVYKILEEREDDNKIEDSITSGYNIDVPVSSGFNDTREENKGRITNGYNAYEGQFPYQVFLNIRHYKMTITCGGSLIGSQWILTAAHCTSGAISVTVYLGSTRRYYGKSFTVYKENIIVHNGFRNVMNDISLIKIPAVSLNSPYIQPVKLPAISNYYSSYAGETVIVSGWGQTSDTNYSGSNYLQWARLPVITNNVCAATHGPYITSSNICAATPGRVSTCFGDSGGPMVLENSKLLIGITSFSHNSNKCELGYPTGFARITTYLDWIRYYTGIYYT